MDIRGRIHSFHFNTKKVYAEGVDNLPKTIPFGERMCKTTQQTPSGPKLSPYLKKANILAKHFLQAHSCACSILPSDQVFETGNNESISRLQLIPSFDRTQSTQNLFTHSLSLLPRAPGENSTNSNLSHRTLSQRRSFHQKNKKSIGANKIHFHLPFLNYLPLPPQHHFPH